MTPGRSGFSSFNAVNAAKGMPGQNRGLRPNAQMGAPPMQPMGSVGPQGIGGSNMGMATGLGVPSGRDGTGMAGSASQYGMGQVGAQQPQVSKGVGRVAAPMGAVAVGQMNNGMPAMPQAPQQQPFDPNDPNNAALAGYMAPSGMMGSR